MNNRENFKSEIKKFRESNNEKNNVYNIMN